MANVATLAAIVVGMTAAAVYRRGAFYPLDAFGVVLVSLFLVAAALRRDRDGAALAVTFALGGLAVWWLVRAVTAQSVAAFLPFGASILGFLAAFLVIRHLHDEDRSRVVMAVVAIGALSAAAGVTAVLGHWHPLSQLSLRYWVLASTLTYPAGAAALFIIALLAALALDLRTRPVRIAVCLCVAGLISTQSHWDLLALAAGALAIPPRRWLPALWPLATGALGGLAVVACAAGRAPGWLSAVAVAVAVGVATTGRLAGAPDPTAFTAPGPAMGTAAVSAVGSRRWVVAVGLAVVALGIVAATVLPLFGPGPRQPVDQGQTLAWSSSENSWRSAVLIGVGPPKVITAHEDVDTYPGVVPDGYLTVLAEGGLVGALLLLGAGAAVGAAFVRRDLISSCAAGGAVAFAVAGAVDFDWQLPALALLGGCVAGLASRPRRKDPGRPPAPESPRESARRRLLTGPVALWSVSVVALVSVQLAVGSTQQAGGVSGVGGGSGVSRDAGSASRPIQSAQPAPLAIPAAPARLILSNDGNDNTDPYMLKVGDTYYLYTSEGGFFLNVPLWIGTRLGRWGSLIDALPHLPAWANGGLTWAPDVQKVEGGWALYFTVLLRGVSPATHCIGAAFAHSPSGPFVATAHPFICQLAHRGSIDARVFVEADGQLVMLWKSDDNANPAVAGPDQDGTAGIWAQDLSANGMTLLGAPTEIFSPSEPWEGTIVEAPDMIEAWGTYWLFYSGNWFNTTSYGIGVAQCQSPFGPCADPDPTPFIGSNLQGVGPGEESLYENAGSVYLLYDPFKDSSPAPVIPRPVAMARLGFTPYGPYLATP